MSDLPTWVRCVAKLYKEVVNALPLFVAVAKRGWAGCRGKALAVQPFLRTSSAARVSASVAVASCFYCVGWLPVDDKVAKESKGLIPADMVPESDEKPAKRTVTKES